MFVKEIKRSALGVGIQHLDMGSFQGKMSIALIATCGNLIESQKGNI